MNNKGKEVKITYWAAHATTIVSVTLVLLIIGLISMISVAARQETRRMKESLEISVIMADSVSNAGAAATMKEMQKLPYCRNLRLISKEEAMKVWKEETGEDLEVLFGVNPLSPEITFTMPESWSAPDAIRKMNAQLSKLPGVESVAVPDGEMVENMNTNIGKMSAVLGLIAIVMLIISFVLINNTVHLTVYARRFIIHTMQLVGAKDGFIRRPIVTRNFLAGVLAGMIAAVILGAALFTAPEVGYKEIGNIIDWKIYAVVSAGLIIIGGAICSISAVIATTRYLHRDYNQLVTGN